MNNNHDKCQATTDSLRNDFKSLVVAAEDVLAWIVPVPEEAAHIFAEFPQVVG